MFDKSWEIFKSLLSHATLQGKLPSYGVIVVCEENATYHDKARDYIHYHPLLDLYAFVNFLVMKLVITGF